MRQRDNYVSNRQNNLCYNTHMINNFLISERAHYLSYRTCAIESWFFGCRSKAPGTSGNQRIARTLSFNFHVCSSFNRYFIGSLTGSPIPKWWNILKYFHVFILPVTATKFQTETRCHLSQQNRWLPANFNHLLTADFILLTADFICWNFEIFTDCWLQGNYWVVGRIHFSREKQMNMF